MKEPEMHECSKINKIPREQWLLLSEFVEYLHGKGCLNAHNTDPTNHVYDFFDINREKCDEERNALIEYLQIQARK